MFVQEYHIRQAKRLGAGDQLGQNMIPTIEPDGGRQQQADLLAERRQAGGGIARGGDEDTRVDDAGEVGIFVVKVELLGSGAIRCGFVEFEVFLEGSVGGDVGGEGFPCCEGSAELGAFLGGFGSAEGESAAIEVLTTLASGAADHGGEGGGEGEGIMWKRV